MKEWVTLGQTRMVDARVRRGLSREALGRKMHVSSKTIERWEIRGEVPRYDLTRYARELSLHIEEVGDEGEPVRIDAHVAERVAVEELAKAASELAEALHEFREEIAALRQDRQASVESQ